MKTKQLSLKEHNTLVIGEALANPLNRWGTGEEIGHPPNADDIHDRGALIMHFIKNGGVSQLYIAQTHEITA